MNMGIINHLHRLLLIIIIFFLVKLLIGQDFQKIDSLQLSLKITEYPKDKIETLLILSNELKKNDPAKALDYANNANNLAKEIGYEEGILNSMITIAEINQVLADYNKAMDFALKSKEMAEELGMNKELVSSLHLIGLIYVELDNFDKGGELFFECLELSEQINYDEGKLNAYSDIGRVYFEQKQYEKALMYCINSLNLAKEVNDLNGIARQLNNIAAIHGTMNNYKEASQYLEEALVFNQEFDDEEQKGIIYQNLGIINSNIENYDIAIEFYRKALLIFEKLQNNILIIKCQLNLGEHYLKVNQIEKSLEYATIVFDEANINDFKSISHKVAELLRKIYTIKNDTFTSMKYEIIEYKMKDSLNIEESMAKLSKLELQYEFNKKEQEKISKHQKKEYLYIIIIISLGFSFVLITTILLNQQRIKSKNAVFERKHLESKIEHKNKELAINVMSLIKKNEMISDISNSIIQVQSKAVKEETKEALTKIAKKLKKNTESEIWQEFEVRFKQVHGEFYTKLFEDYPDLSQGEQRLCAFLRLNMTTKEISVMTGQSTTALEMARHRLRKKLKISNTDINLVTFLSQV